MMTADRDHDILRLKRCPDCGYDLVGLPDTHTCPECGYTYDDSEFIVSGWSSRLGVWGRWFVIVVFAAALIACIFIPNSLTVALAIGAMLFSLFWIELGRVAKAPAHGSGFDLYMNKNGYCELNAHGASAFHR